MKKKKICRSTAILFASMVAVLIVGCGGNDKVVVPSEEMTESIHGTEKLSEAEANSQESIENTELQTENVIDESDLHDTEEIDILVKSEAEELGLTDQQMNSFSMLYYLAITAEEIRSSKDNRLLLDDIYTSLLNDINPGAIDETTQDHLKNLRDIIKSYRNISVKRERLQYIYNQNKAAAMRSAVPNPLAILSVTNALDWKKLAISTVYTVVDSYNNYKNAKTSADNEFLMSGWELDDEETDTIQKNRERAFDYMVDIVQEYHLDGKLTLNEKAIENFANICAIDSVQQKIRRLESEEETYKLLGNYWLELADSYFQISQYEECLKCAERYNSLATGIYRKDFNYVQILPEVIVAAQETYSGTEYNDNVSKYADDIMENTGTEDWSIRYFAAKVYLDLYARTEDNTYLENAYNIAYDNVTILLEEQRTINATYLDDVQDAKVEEPDYRYMTDTEKKEAEQEYKNEKSRVKAYNNEQKANRETELPTLYEPLVLNCDLLFALADKKSIGEEEKKQIEAILQTDTNGVFLTKPVNSRYSFSTEDNSYEIKLKRKEIIVPVELLTDNFKIEVMVYDGDKSTTIDDCAVSEVERKDNNVDSFIAHISSDQLYDYDWTDESKVTIKIYSADGYEPLIFKFKIADYTEKFWILEDKVEFEAI